LKVHWIPGQARNDKSANLAAKWQNYYSPGNLIRHSGRSEAESRNPAKATELLDSRLRGNDRTMIKSCSF
jgi:hypothetical protein